MFSQNWNKITLFCGQHFGDESQLGVGGQLNMYK